MTGITLEAIANTIDTPIEELKLACMLIPEDLTETGEAGPAMILQLLLFDFLRQTGWEIDRVACLLRYFGSDLGEYGTALDAQLAKIEAEGTGSIPWQFLEIFDNRYTTMVGKKMYPLVDLVEDKRTDPPPVPPVYSVSLSVGLIYVSKVAPVFYPEVHRRLLSGTLLVPPGSDEQLGNSDPSSSSPGSGVEADSVASPGDTSADVGGGE